jgi:hypothetical protein
MNPASPLRSMPSNDSDKLRAAADDAAITESRMRRRVVLASVLGNGLEWFDFVSYGYFASIIAKVFFPADSNLSLMLPMRPLRWDSWCGRSAASCSAPMPTATGGGGRSRC